MPIFFKFFQAGCGDAIQISFEGNSGLTRHILIDGGFQLTYTAQLQKILRDMPESEFIDLWIVTHLDNDHIGSVYAHFKDKSIRPGKLLINRLWFNCVDRMEFPNHSTKAGIASGVGLRDLLTVERCPEVVNDVTTKNEAKEIDGVTITVLSPDKITYQALQEDWEKQEKAYWEKKTKSKTADDEPSLLNDDALDIAELADRKDIAEDETDIANRSSIAVLLEHKEISALFLGDAHPSIIIHSIKALNEKRGVKLKVDYIKIAHHASKHNFNAGLLDEVDCQNFIVLSKGESCQGLPNKETLAKIIVKRKERGKTNIFFNYDQDRFRKMFSIENESEYEFECFFPKENENFLRIGDAF